LASLMLLAGAGTSAWAQTASLPPPLEPVIQCGPTQTDPDSGTACQAVSAAWVVPSVAASHLAMPVAPSVAASQFVMPTGLPRAGGGSASESVDAR